MDVASVVTYISGTVTPAVTALGAAVLVLIVGIKGYKWVRGAM